AIAFKVVYFKSLRFAAIFRSESHGELAFAFYHRISSPVLVAKCMTDNDNGGSPVGYQAGNVVDNDRLAENGTIQDITDGAIGALPHLFEAKFFNAGLIGSDSSAFNTYAILFYGIGRIYSYL